ncbi:hypothetical protein FHS77_002896 [Paenochrobactrum gallinarii]|uniref:Uncharacterized protein n=1 Tax=Paenochrobactrum gallinarii TaxID=643673 RepID=A0A841M9V9_9HYPH|nr:hypothetical protein [Paenochrobactrum gallinarii]
MIKSEYDGCCDADSGHEDVRTSIIAGMDASPVFELSKHIFDPMSLTVEHCVMWNENLAVGL